MSGGLKDTLRVKARGLGFIVFFIKWRMVPKVRHAVGIFTLMKEKVSKDSCNSLTSHQDPTNKDSHRMCIFNEI